MKWLFITGGLTVAAVFGSVWFLGYLAFGEARCTDINPWAAMALVGLAVIVLLLVFHLFDGFSDWVAGRAAVDAGKSQAEVMEGVRTMSKAQLAQAQAVAAMMRAGNAAGNGQPEPEGGLDF